MTPEPIPCRRMQSAEARNHGAKSAHRCGRHRRQAAPRLLASAIAPWCAATALLHAGPVHWRKPPENYTVTPQTVTASDLGRSTPDRYLLTRNEYTDFALSFDVTRLPAGGDRLRAIVVWGVDSRNPANRDSFFLPVHDQKVGETVHYDIVKLGARFSVRRNGVPYTTRHVPYGRPRPKGPVGFLHYYNYHFRYSNIRLASLSTADLPPPANLTAAMRKGGVVHLSWTMPEPFAGIVMYRVFRRTVAPETTKSTPLLTVDACEARDVNVRSETTYAYSVASCIGSDCGPSSPEVRVQTGRAPPPRPPADLDALLRIDGSVRLSWRLPDDSRCAGFRIVRSGTVLAPRLAPGVTRFLAPPPADPGTAFEVFVLDPDGKRDAGSRVLPEPSAPPVHPGAPWPSRHPFLRYSAADLDRIRRLARTDPAVRKVIDTLRAGADAVVRTPPEVPEKRLDATTDAAHRKLAGRLRQVALAWGLTRDPRYAAWVRRAMLAYADLYPTLKPHLGGRARLMATNGGLNEVIWYVRVLCAYDVVCDSPVFSQDDRAKIAKNLLRPAANLFRVRDYHNPDDPRARDLHYKCYNFQAWFNAAVGLTGLFLRDPDLVEHAIDGPYGFKHLLKHDVRDDGIFWERSLGYHNFVLAALFPFLEAAWHCNLDLWHLEVPDDYNEDRENIANYCVGDGDNGPKSIKLMLDGPFYTIFGDRTYANIGDSNPGPLRAYRYYLAGYRRFQDPKYAWLYRADHGGQHLRRLYRGAPDLSGTVYAAYDNSFLYIAAEITDDVVRNTHAAPADVWAGDALWIGLKWSDASRVHYDFIFGLSPGDFARVPPVAAVFNRFGAVANTASGGRLAVRRTATGWTLEFAVPWSEFQPRRGETGTPLQPHPGMTITADFVLYDGDATSGPSRKEKMLGWSCRTDRYDPGQGGKIVFGGPPPASDGRIIDAPQASRIVVDGDLADWKSIPTHPAHIGPGSAVMTDRPQNNNLDELIYGIPPPEAGHFDLSGTSFCNNGIIQAGCTLFPSTGWAVLRGRIDQTGLPPRDALCCTFTWGPHGGGHGHPDKLSIVLYADGKHWIPDFGSCPYGSPEKGTWTAQTISHNTVVVDETSQYPTGKDTPQWPCDSATHQARGFLDFFQCDPLLKVVQARNTAVYDGILLRRTVAIVGDAVVVDFFQITSAGMHQYDYPLHIDGAPAGCSVPVTPHPGPLAKRPGYMHITDIRRGMTDHPVLTEWSDSRRRRLRLSFAPSPGTEVILGNGITNRVDRKMPVLILRRRARSTLFAGAFQPCTLRNPQPPRWISAPPGVAAVEVPLEDGAALVVFNGTDHETTVNGFRVAGRIGVRWTTPDGRQQRVVGPRTP